MPWKETHVMDERRRVVETCHASLLALSELYRRFEISRKTSYKWLARWEAQAGHPKDNSQWGDSRLSINCVLELKEERTWQSTDLREDLPRYVTRSG